MRRTDRGGVGEAVTLQILPLAITMMAGPQIMSAIVLVTSQRAVRSSLAFLLGVAVAATAGVAVARGLAALLGNAVHIDGESHTASVVGKVVQIVLVGLLILLAVKNYVQRSTSKPPKWLSTLLTASPATAFKTGLVLILTMPSDVIIMLTVGTNLEHRDLGLVAAVPFIALTVLVAALPLIAYLLFHRRAVTAMPKVREWMNSNSWLINIVVCGIFIALVLSGG